MTGRTTRIGPITDLPSAIRAIRDIERSLSSIARDDLEMVEVVDALPDAEYGPKLVLLGETLYRKGAEGYIASTAAGDIVGQIVSAQIADAAITTAKFAQGIEPVAVVDALPNPVGGPSLVFLTTDQKLYRNAGTEYVRSIPAADVSGQLIATQIADAAVTTAKFAQGIEPIAIVNTLPAALGGPSVVFLTTDGKLYRNTGDGYTRLIETSDLDGQILSSQIADAAINTAKFAAGIEPVGIVDVLPNVATGPKLVFLTTDSKLYRNNGTAYVRTVPTTDITGTIVSAQIADAAVNTAKFAAGIEPVAVLNALPAAAGGPSLVFLTTDQKLYRNTGSNYVRTIPTTDLTGTVATAQLADLSVTLDKLAALSVDNSKLVDNAVTAVKVATAAITSTKIADLAVTGAKIADATLAATKFASGIEPVAVVSALPTASASSPSVVLLTSDQKLYRKNAAGTAYSALVATSDLSGTIGSALIADLAVTEAKLADAAVSTAKLLDNAVSSLKIAADSVTSAKIATGAVLDTKLAANAVTTSKIADNAITAAKIADAQLTTAKFAAGIEPVAIVGALPAPVGGPKVVLLTTDSKLYRNNGSAYVASVPTTDLSGTIASAQIAAGAVLEAALAANAVTTGKIADSAITTAKIADAQLTTAKFAAGIEPVSVLGVLPAASASSPSLVFLTTDRKLYRKNAANNAYIVTVPTTDLTGTITNAQLAVDSVQGAVIAAAAITSTKIADGSIETAKLAAGAVTAGKIAAGTITANEIAASAITTTQLAAGAVTAAKIAAATITSAEIAADTIVAGNIAAGAIGAAEIAAGAVVAGKIAANAVTAAEIAAGSITTAKIAANAVTATEIAADAIVAAKIAAGAVTTAKIAALAVTAAEIAAGAITTAKIAAGAVTAAEIAADTITAAQIAAGAISTSELAAGAVTAAKIAALTITAAELAAGAITTAKIAANAVTATEIAADAVTAAKIAAGSITTAKIAAGAVTTTELAADSVTSAKILAGAVVAGKIAANAVTATEIAAGAVTAGKIAALAVTAAEIAAGAVTTAKIAAGAVTANELAANSVIAGKVAAGAISTTALAASAVTAAKIAAGAITARELYVGDFSNLAEDGTFEAGGTTWTVNGGGWSITTVGARSGGKAAQRPPQATASYYENPRFVECAPGDMFYGEAWALITAATTGTSGIQITWHDANRAYLSTTNGTAVNSATSAGVYTKVTVTGTAPANAVYARIRVHANNTAGDPALVDDVLFRRMVTGAVVVDGAITAVKIAAGSITTEKLAALAVTAAEIAAGAVTTAKIAAGAVTATEIAAGAVITAKLAANAVTANEIAANAVTTAKIAAGAVTATQIAADTITAGQIAAGAIGATEIAAGAVLTDKLAANAVTAAKIAALTITAAELAAGAITTAKLAAGAVTANELAANAVIAGKIAAGAISASEIAAGAITTDKIFAGAVITEKLAIGAVTADKLAANSVIAGKVQAGAIGAAEIAALAISAGHLAAGSVTTAKIAALAVTANEIAAGAITTAKIAAGAVTANEIAADTITAGQIAAGAISASEIATDAVIAAKIAAGAVTTAKIAALAVTAGEIAAGAITTAKIAAGAVTANEIAANTITAAKIAAGTITATELAANSVTTAKINAAAVDATKIAANVVATSHLLVGSQAQRVNDVTTTGTTDGWVVLAGSVSPVVATDVLKDSVAVRTLSLTSTGTNNSVATALFEIDPRVTYEVKVSLWSDKTNTDGNEYFGMYAYASDGSTILNITPFTHSNRTFGTPTNNGYFWSGDVTTTGPAWRDMVGYIIGTDVAEDEVPEGKNVTTSFKLPANAVKVRLRFLNYRLTYAGTVRLDLYSISVTPVLAAKIHGSMLVTGTVTAGAIAAGTITGDKLVAGTITATQIATDAITSVKIAADAITTDKLAVGAVTATEIASGAITTAKIAAGAVTATEIASNAITAVKIAADAITADKISASAIANSGATAGVLFKGTLPGTWTRYLNLTATGTSSFLKHESLDLKADGSAVFSGTVAATTFTAAVASFIGISASSDIVIPRASNALATAVLAVGDNTGGIPGYSGGVGRLTQSELTLGGRTQNSVVETRLIQLTATSTGFTLSGGTGANSGLTWTSAGLSWGGGAAIPSSTMTPAAHVHSAADITSGVLASALLSGAYTGITSIGTLASIAITGTATAAWFSAAIGIVVRRDGSDRWYLYNNSGDTHLYVRDVVNSRTHVSFTPGASVSAADMAVHSQLTVDGNILLAGALSFNAGGTLSGGANYLSVKSASSTLGGIHLTDSAASNRGWLLFGGGGALALYNELGASPSLQINAGSGLGGSLFGAWAVSSTLTTTGQITARGRPVAEYVLSNTAPSGTLTSGVIHFVYI